MFVCNKGRKSFSTTIQEAIRWNNQERLRTLIEGINLKEAKDHKGTTLLHLAVRKRSIKTLKFFIENGCDINARDNAGKTALLCAVKSYLYAAIEVLLHAKTDITLSDKTGKNVLNFMSKSRPIKRLKLIALIANYLKECELDIKELTSLIQEAKWPVHYAIYIGNSELIRLMLEAGCDVDSCDEETDHYTALHVAIIHSDIESMKVLLKYGADTERISYQGSKSQLPSAVRCRETLETLLDYRESLLEGFNSDGKMISFKNFSTVHYSVVELLLVKYKINLTTKDKQGNTFLHYVVVNHDEGIINLLSKIYFDANIRNHNGDTLLHAVIGRNYPSCMEMLIHKGAYVNAKNNEGKTPLTVALAKLALEKEFEILFENGAIVDEKMQTRILTDFANRKFSVHLINCIIKHMAILYLQNKISEKNFKLIENIRRINLEQRHSMYLEELNVMKSNLITVHSNVTVFDILSAPENRLVKYARNEAIIGQFAEIDFQSCYPIFGKQLKKRFELAIIKQNLNKNAIDELSKNIEQLKCNLKVIENIIEYLSLDDLKRLKRSYPSV